MAKYKIGDIVRGTTAQFKGKRGTVLEIIGQSYSTKYRIKWDEDHRESLVATRALKLDGNCGPSGRKRKRQDSESSESSEDEISELDSATSESEHEVEEEKEPEQ